MVFGYIRVSKTEQNYDLQIDSLKKFGCESIFQEKKGATKSRKEFDGLLNQLRKGDVVVVWRIDRLGRTTLQLIKLMCEFREKGVEFVSISEGIDTRTTMGRVWYMLSSIMAENERNTIIERTKAGLEAARARGRNGGRPVGLSEKSKEIAKNAAMMYRTEKLSVTQICRALKIGSNATLYKYLRYEGVNISGWKKLPKATIDE